jgi:O-antigen/teichoic acid export membrane protein
MITETSADRPAAGEARRVARNSLAPFAANLVGRAMSIVLAVVMARTLGAGGTGLYAVAVNLWLYASIVADFGLGTWLTREVARNREGARETVADALGLRLLLSLLALPALLGAGLVAGYVQAGRPDLTLLVAVGLLGIGLLPGAYSAAGTALYNAFEEMTFPAGVQLVSAALTTVAGIGALLLGHDVVALAVVSLGVNLCTAAIIAVACGRRFFPLAARLHPARQLALIRDAFPLMLNSLLNNVFFRFDVQVLQSKGTAVVGYYANAYKVIDAAGTVPSSFVLALFPLLSRRAGAEVADEASGLDRVYRLALKLLIATALPLAVVITYLADEVVRLFWGASFLPDSAVALRILIWFLPLSFFNGLTQYVLIAVGRQARITVAFAVAALFNVGANLLLIPRFGYVAAAGVTIVSEVVLLVPFLLALRGRVAVGPAAAAAVRPLPAALAAALLLWLLRDAAGGVRLLAALGGGALYLGLLWPTGVFSRAEWGILLTLLPASVRRRQGRPRRPQASVP